MNNRIHRTDLALLAMRSMVGVVFLFHGSQKLFGLFGGYGIEGTAGWMESIGIPFPVLSATLAGAVEFAGGIALVTGFGQRLLSVPLTLTMLVAAFVTRGGGFDVVAGGMEYPLTLAIVVAALGVLGPGRVALSPAKSALPAAGALETSTAS